MAVYKPHLLPVSRTTRNLYNTLISLVRRQTPYPDARLLHRLDTETAGIIMLAKTALADRYWKPRLHELITEKIYHARVRGVPKWQSYDCSCYVAEKQGGAVRSQMYVVEPECSELYIKPKFSRTQFRVIGQFGQETMVECRLLTGRKHQIRAQLAWLGHPIVGDKIYSHRGRYYLKRIESGLNQADLQALGSPFHCLTAVSLLLSIDGQEIRLSLS
ncbi:MAG: RNA pseudouridine synthase [Amphritea sp.]|nr:RNA pseudouridine synthase [Amphritea sp.]